MFVRRFRCVPHGEDARQAAIRGALIGVNPGVGDGGNLTWFWVGDKRSAFAHVGRLRRIPRAGFFAFRLFDASKFCIRGALGASRIR